MNFKKILKAGIIAGIASFIIGNILYMNPLTAGIYSASSAAYCSKDMNLFGGIVPWIGLMFIGGMLSAIVLAIIYSLAEKEIPGNALKKGILFGSLFWLASGLPNAYYTWLLHSYPDAMILIEAVNGLIGTLVVGIVIAIIFERK